MSYTSITEAVFISRPNRFIARVAVDGAEETVHVKNTGRCKELLVPGARVWLEKSQNPSRKTGYDLVCVMKEGEGREPLLINIDSQIVNGCAEEWARRLWPTARIRREVTYGDSRFDLCVEENGKTTFIEVKGVTLEKDGIASFPDAPTERGVKHIEELIALKEQGFGAAILFVIQMKGITEFRPNDETHPAFGDALRRAVASGVQIYAYDCTVTPDTMTIDKPVEVRL